MKHVMRSVTCTDEAAVRDAAGHRELDAELAAHVAGCVACGETLRVASALREASADGPEPRLPAAGQLWWRAQIVRRLKEPERRSERAAWPVKWGLGLGGTAVLTGLLLTAAFLLEALRTSLTSVSLEVSTSWLALGFGALVLPLAALVVFLFLIGQDA